MDAYKGVYEGRDPDGAATLFTDGSTYQWGPFDGRRLLYDGVFAVALEGDLCQDFREWWNTSEEPLG